MLRLSERKQTRLFLRRDRYGRYMSCLVYLPRDRYTTKVRLRAQEILTEALHGASVDYSATIGDSALARLHVVVRAERGRPVPQVDAAALERRLAAAVRSWDEDLAAEATRVLGEERARHAARPVLGRASPRPTRRTSRPQDAVDDLTTMLGLREAGPEFAVRLVEQPERWTLVVYRSGSPITLSDVLPQLQHMGLEVVDEHPYQFAGRSSAGSFWIYEFGLRPPAAAAAGSLRQVFEDALTALWHGQTEDDGFNALVLTAGLTWREVTLLRAYAKYLRQARRPVQRGLRAAGAARPTRPSPGCWSGCSSPGSTRPGRTARPSAARRSPRRSAASSTRWSASTTTGSCASYLALIDATLRTNYYQTSPGGPTARLPGAQARPGQRARG